MTKKETPSWVGPVAGAVILIGGYVAYSEWKENDLKSEECVRLEAAFKNSMDAMLGSGAIEEAKRVGNQSPMASLADDVAANELVLNRLNSECPGWMNPD